MFRYLTRDTLIPIGRHLSTIPNGSKFRLTHAARLALLQASAHDVLMEHGWVAMDEPYRGISHDEHSTFARVSKLRSVFAANATDSEWTYLKKHCRHIAETLLKDNSLLTMDFDYGMVVAFNYKEGYELSVNSQRNCLVIRSYVAQHHGKTYPLQLWPKQYLDYVNRGKKKSEPVTLDKLFDKRINVTWAEIKEKMNFFDVHPTMRALERASHATKKILELYKGEK